MDRDRFAEALMSFGDTVNQAYGGKQNIYGTYQEQKTKRMEQEARAEAARQKLQNQAILNQASSGTARPTYAAVDPSDPTGMTLITQPNPNYIAPESDIVKGKRQAEMKMMASKGFIPANEQDLIGFRGNRALGSAGQRYIQPKLPAQAMTVQEKDQIRRSFNVGGGFIPESEMDAFKERSGIDARNLAKTLGLEKTTDGGQTGYSFPPDALARPLLSAKGQESLIKAKKEAGGAGAEAGRIVLAQESLDGIDKIKKIVFPKGTPDSVNWGALFKSNIMGKAVPRDYEGQTIKRLTKTMLSGRQLIQTGVAARPDETEALWDSFAANIMSDPKAASEAYDQLFNFYEGYLNVNDPQGVFRDKISGGKKQKQAAGVNLDEIF